MKTVPLTVVDNFFDNPDSVRKWALSLDFQKDTGNRWPGKRSAYLHELNNDFFQAFCNKVVSLHSSEDEIYNDSIQYIARTQFQLIKAGDYIGGWVHQDVHEIMTAIVYLSPEGGFNNGTSLYRLKDDLVSYDGSYNQFKNYSSTQFSDEEAEKGRKQNNDQFIETARIGGFYNRLMVFDSTDYHSVENYNLESGEDRLTLIAFFEKVRFGISPISKIKRVTH